jgi:regulator of sigma E protease
LEAKVILTILYLVGMFTLLVAAHEFGHMWMAKRFRMLVEEFAIGVGPILVRLGRDRDGTLYTIRMLPVGGFVRIAGMLPDEVQHPNSFASRPLYMRFLTVLAGPLASILFGFVLFVIVGLTAGLPSDKTTPRIRFVQPDSPAQKAGLRIGDVLVAVNGEPVHTTEQAAKIIRASANKPLQLTLKRENQTLTVQVTPRLEEVEMGKGRKQKIGRIGVVWHTERRREPVGTVLKRGALLTITISVGIVDSLRRLLFGQGNIHEVGSVISIVSVTGATARLGFADVADFAASLSTMLGIVNLLPIPILDGGYLLIFLVEALRRRQLSAEAMARVQAVGLVIVLALFLTVFSLDIYKLITGKLIR